MLWAVEPRRVPVTLVVIAIAFATIRSRTVEKAWVHETPAPVHEFSFCVCVFNLAMRCLFFGFLISGLFGACFQKINVLQATFQKIRL